MELGESPASSSFGGAPGKTATLAVLLVVVGLLRMDKRSNLLQTVILNVTIVR